MARPLGVDSRGDPDVFGRGVDGFAEKQASTRSRPTCLICYPSLSVIALIEFQKRHKNYKKSRKKRIKFRQNFCGGKLFAGLRMEDNRDYGQELNVQIQQASFFTLCFV